MKTWKIIANIALPLLRGAGEAKKAEDANNTGKDDAQGVGLVFAADLIEAILNDKKLPTAPAELR